MTMQNSAIEWTDHTFNPWWGCIKVSPGCEHCYADTLAHRYGFDVWGPAKTTSRRMMSENYWRQPHKWNKEAAASGVRRRVFCASMADVFEEHPQVIDARARLFNLIEATPALDWLLLTKRPENINAMVPWHGGVGRYHGWPANVWIGTSVENQEQADKRIPHLLRVPAAVRFLSCEPLLGAVDLPWCKWCGGWGDHDCYAVDDDSPSIDWVIVGGESGHGARPMHPAWARGLRDQCQAAGVPFFFKQWGNHLHHTQAHLSPRVWTEDEARRGFKDIGKHAAGRELDGQTWNEVPA